MISLDIYEHILERNRISHIYTWFRTPALILGVSEIAAYLRVSSLAIALFDFVSTIPGELRLYSRQSSFKRTSPACIFFILVRYISVAALVTSNVGFFAEGFTLVACRHFYLIAPVLKLMATLVSQVIIGVRTYAIARKSRWVVWALGILFVITLVPEIMGNVVRRVVVQKHGRLVFRFLCTAMIFDAVAMGIASYYLILSSRGMKYPMVTDLSRMMLQEGIVYFLALTAFNILNLVLFRGDNFEMQSAATTLGQAVTMIFSQKLILSLSDCTFEQHQLREREYSTSSEFLPDSRIMLHPSVPPPLFPFTLIRRHIPLLVVTLHTRDPDRLGFV
ncbi:hypothetical protein PNOK_0672400 [Pyrrhoderma noxium]|uniref:DUF6533 domain-containing protein n=1 Tax=Pyrrhoderma noxium TaxID=2282107 RepID=A0A286UFC4_9AGAM|nr:hypothetical protein PNOK_0672400 [Pyrrhoderma noxium]